MGWGGQMHQLLSQWGYLALFGVCVLSSAGIPIGAEFAIGYAGAVSSGRLSLHIHLQLPVVIWVARSYVFPVSGGERAATEKCAAKLFGV